MLSGNVELSLIDVTSLPSGETQGCFFKDADMLTKGELSLIGDQVGGTFYGTDDSCLVYLFSSNTFPAHRIRVNVSDAERVIREIAARIIECSRAD